MQPHENVILVFVKDRPDWAIVRQRHWYRLPVRKGPPEITAQWIAFYLPGAFGEEKWGVYYYARIIESHIVRRVDLFPHEPRHPRADEHYHCISFEPPKRLARPLRSKKSRRFVCSETTIYRLTAARTLDELFSNEPIIHPGSEQMLVGVVPSVRDMDIARERGWYRIPVGMVRDWRSPGHLAFYHGRGFGSEAGKIQHYAPIWAADLVKRIDLFPDEENHPRAFDDYIRVHLGEVKSRPRPIISRRPRRVVIMPTTLERFMNSNEINELYVGDEAKEVLYGQMTEEQMKPEREYYVRGTNAYYLTDFALFCRKRNVQVDVDSGKHVQEGIVIPAKPKRAAPPDGWEAVRLSRYDITRRPEEALRRVRSIVMDGGGISE